jgi:hypothetical protein
MRSSLEKVERLINSVQGGMTPVKEGRWDLKNPQRPNDYQWTIPNTIPPTFCGMGDVVENLHF